MAASGLSLFDDADLVAALDDDDDALLGGRVGPGPAAAAGGPAAGRAALMSSLTAGAGGGSGSRARPASLGSSSSTTTSSGGGGGGGAVVSSSMFEEDDGPADATSHSGRHSHSGLMPLGASAAPSAGRTRTTSSSPDASPATRKPHSPASVSGRTTSTSGGAASPGPFSSSVPERAAGRAGGLTLWEDAQDLKELRAAVVESESLVNSVARRTDSLTRRPSNTAAWRSSLLFSDGARSEDGTNGLDAHLAEEDETDDEYAEPLPLPEFPHRSDKSSDRWASHPVPIAVDGDSTGQCNVASHASLVARVAALEAEVAALREQLAAARSAAATTGSVSAVGSPTASASAKSQPTIDTDLQSFIAGSELEVDPLMGQIPRERENSSLFMSTAAELLRDVGGDSAPTTSSDVDSPLISVLSKATGSRRRRSITAGAEPLDPLWQSEGVHPAQRRVLDGPKRKPKGAPRRAVDVEALFTSTYAPPEELASGPSTASASVSSDKGSLFADMDEVSAELHPREVASKPSVSSPTEADHLLQDFLNSSAGKPLAQAFSQFLAKIVSAAKANPPAPETDLADQVHDFVEGAMSWLQEKPWFATAADSAMERVRDDIEKMIMTRLHPYTFGVNEDVRKADAAFHRRLQILQFLGPDHFDVPAPCRNEVVLSIASDELARMNGFLCPAEKLACVVRCCDVLFGVLNLQRSSSLSRPGADDFLPVFIFVVLRANVRRLIANIEYISAFRDPAGLMSKAGYCFANLRSAVHFLQHTVPSAVNLSEEEFARQYAAAEAVLEAAHVHT